MKWKIKTKEGKLLMSGVSDDPEYLVNECIKKQLKQWKELVIEIKQ